MNKKSYLLLAALTALAISSLFYGPTVIAQVASAPVAVASPVPSPAVAAPSSGNAISKALAWIWGPGGAVLFFMLWALSEAMANAFPSLEANSAFQFFRMGIRKVKERNPMQVSSEPPASAGGPPSSG